MHKRNKSKNKSESMMPIQKIIITAVSGAAGTIISVLLTLIFSAVLSKSPALSDKLGIYFIISVLLGGFFCGLISSRKSRLKGIVAGALSSLFFCLFIFALMLIFSHGQLSSQTAFLAVAMIILCVVGGICGANMKRRK
ncbi:MAG: TIGR04086 family membrane protein [Candidatus Fimenecus sp.]